MYPSAASITAAQAAWYDRTTSRMSSGSRRSDSAVEFARSQNITVRWRRSPAGSGVVTSGPGGSSEEVSPVPQYWQKRLAAGFDPPQPEQATVSGCPQLPQNEAPLWAAHPQAAQYNEVEARSVMPCFLAAARPPGAPGPEARGRPRWCTPAPPVPGRYRCRLA